MPPSQETNSAPALSKLERSKLWFYRAWAVVAFCAICWVVYKLCGTFKPMLEIILLTGLFSFILRRPVAWMASKGVHRGWASAIAIILAIAVVVGIGFVIFPPIVDQVGQLVNNLPGHLQQITDSFNTFYANNEEVFTNSDVQDIVNSLISSVSSFISNQVPQIAQNVISFSVSTVSGIVTIVMSIVATFWILKDLPTIGREVKVLGGPKHALDLEITRAIGVRVFGGYIRGLLVASACTGTFAGIGFWIVGVPYPGLLGLITGLLNVIPYIGPWTGGILAAIAGLFVSPWTALGSLVVSVVAQQGTDTFITPRVYGSTVELHPALVIVALAAGQAIGGVVGMIAAVPVAAALKAIIIYFFEKKTGRQLVSEDGAFFRGKRGAVAAEVDPAFDATGGAVSVAPPADVQAEKAGGDERSAPEGAPESPADVGAGDKGGGA